jgi:hypothetical protein
MEWQWVYRSVVGMGWMRGKMMERWIRLARRLEPELGCTKAIPLGFWKG